MKISDLRAGEENGDVVLMETCDPNFRRIRVTAESTDGRGHPEAKSVGTGFSGGIDSFATISMDLARARGVDLRREINALDLFRARMLNGRLHTFIRNSPLLKRLAKGFFR